ncbi:GDSL-type esterase/lipase family protein [Microbispora sp. H11081]|uniref:GDSL-type esterase/lipase family protein n=1 Tax=Microbispora sp. H11081 TaxID=2729107 RepID=UPI001475F526|nr:GDSL-type esterase/lipase family protein [Microbispora sp. H11081]
MGDSISHGLEGDYTWRYRLARHFAARGAPVRFTGPWSGTCALPDLAPREGAAATRAGGYRPGTVFPHDLHHARWGGLMDEARGEIADAVAAHRPGLLMVALGFNDLAWGVSGPERLLTHVGEFVRRAREARPDLRFLVADVVRRTPLPHLPHLPEIVETYNARLPGVLAALSTPCSPVVHVGLAAVYDPHADTYDGLHPNSVGEFKIAKAFADAYSRAFQGGRLDFATPVPADAEPLPIRAPGGIAVAVRGATARISWSRVFGASGYWLDLRDVDAGSGFERSPLPIGACGCDLRLRGGGTYEARVSAARGDQETRPTRAVRFVLEAGRESAALFREPVDHRQYDWVASQV